MFSRSVGSVIWFGAYVYLGCTRHQRHHELNRRQLHK
ncbi:unnamed protein product [Ixodes pacificus]